MSATHVPLPIYEVEDALIRALQDSNRVILQAPTGSGKSTQVPQMLLRHRLLGAGQVVILQPRRLAARLLAARVASEMKVPLGREVGYQVRFENVTQPSTVIKFETEGILLRQMLQDPNLPGIQAVIFDEFHERHLYGDITLARALDIQDQHRPDLRVLVMSATLDSGALEEYLRPCKVLRSEGRTFPVAVDYLPPHARANGRAVWDLAAEAFAAYARKESGDVLIFMPGAYEIRRTLEALRQHRESKDYLLLSLHGDLPPQEQDAAVARHDKPKVVVTTNVAETSITIEGVRLVIDSGLARIARHDPHRGINTLLVERISQASAEQRAGRAGRTQAGRCLRLWSRTEHEERPARDVPEMQRLDLAEVVLTLKASGVEDLNRFRWLETPNPKALQHAEELLIDLGALVRPDEQAGQPVSSVITDTGRRMLAFPVHPRYSRMLLAAQHYGCVEEACLIAALTQGRDLLIRNPGPDVESRREDLWGGDHADRSSDFWLLLNAWEYSAGQHFDIDALKDVGIHANTARQVGALREQFLRIATDEGLEWKRGAASRDDLRKCILIGFSDRVSRRADDSTLRCELVHGRRGTLAKESIVRESPLFVAAEVREVSGRPGDVTTILSLATAIETAWLTELFPGDFRTDAQVKFDSSTGRVEAHQVSRFRDLALSSRNVKPPEDEAARVLAAEVLAGRLQLPKWGPNIEAWILRLNLLADWCSDLDLPKVTPDERRHLLEQLCHGAASAKEITSREVRPIVESWLSPAQRGLLDKHAPERIRLSNGKTPKVTYSETGPPFIAMRIQELFDVKDVPKIAMGRVAVSVHILAPSMRPVQVTSDLGNFWKEHYPGIRSELRRKYPKHDWR